MKLEADGNDVTEQRLPVEVGLLIRRQFRQFLERQRFLFEGQMEIVYHETKSLLDSEFLVRVKGPKTLVYAWCSATRDMLMSFDQEK